TAAQSFAAEPVVRMKAKLTAFDGLAMILEPIKASSKKPLTVFITPQTRYVGASRARFDTIKTGDYAGAAVTVGRKGVMRASDVYLYPPALRGSGEGRFPDVDRVIINGTVTAVQFTSADDRNDGTMTLHYRGAVLNSAGPGRTVCEGRASPPAYSSPLACAADAMIKVIQGSQIAALTMGDKRLLVPGVLLTVAMTRQVDGRTVAAGVTVEPPPATVEKPHSSN
ncbi:MAG: hypothetical protein NTX21_00730, partial [Alphaproteobacteria bacterium]|nr:hypothetical protein [Alphaproteobacteria bacterium]